MPLEFSAIEFEYCESLELLEEFFYKYVQAFNDLAEQYLKMSPEFLQYEKNIIKRYIVISIVTVMNTRHGSIRRV